MKGKARRSGQMGSRWGAALLLCVMMSGGGELASGLLGTPVGDAMRSVARAERGEPQTPEELYKQAVRQLDRGYYERAVELFERIKTRYPFSQYAVLSELRLGDTQFNKGEYALAVEAYRNFIKLHPRHPELDYVTWRIAESEFKQAPRIAQRDQAPTRRMLAILQGFEDRYPQSKYTTQVQTMRAEGRTRLARGIFGVGQHYYRRGRFEYNNEVRTKAFKAALERFEQVLADYPDVSTVSAEAFYFIGHIYAREGMKKEADETLARLKARYPQSFQIGRLERNLKTTRWPAVPPAPKVAPAPAEPATAPAGTPAAADAMPDAAPAPAGVEPAQAAPAGTQPAGAEPTGAEPIGAEPTGAEPVPAQPQ